MPVKNKTIGAAVGDDVPRGLVDELVAEFKSQKLFGQPLIEVETFQRTGLVGVTVIWDRWKRVPDMRRTAIILEAYAKTFGESDKVAFAVGMTFDEAAATGKLPYVIFPRFGRKDEVGVEQLKDLADEFGGTIPPTGDIPVVFRFTTLEDAEACLQRLIERVPGSSERNWMITHEVPRPEWAV